MRGLEEILAELPDYTPTVLFENRGYTLHGVYDPTKGWSLVLSNRENKLPVTAHGETPGAALEEFVGLLREIYATGCMKVAHIEKGLRYLKGVQIFMGAPSKSALERIMEEEE